MTSKDLEAALGDAEDAFQRRPENPEVGLEHVSDPAVLQLRKACRLLHAAGFLLDRNGHFTVIIESSFVAIERSIQFYVEEKGYDVAGQRHTEVYELGVRAGLFSRDVADEDSLMFLGWERLETLKSKVESETAYSGEAPEKLDHLAARPMNELIDLGPNTAHMNQKPENPFNPGDRVVKAGDDEPSVGVVVEVMPPEKNMGKFGREMDGEAVRVTFPSSLDKGPGNWREYHPAILASYCHDTDIKLWTYKHENLEFAANPYVPGDRVIKTSHDDPNTAVVVESGNGGVGDAVTVAFLGDFEEVDVWPGKLADHCEENDIKRYTYEAEILSFAG